MKASGLRSQNTVDTRFAVRLLGTRGHTTRSVDVRRQGPDGAFCASPRLDIRDALFVLASISSSGARTTHSDPFRRTTGSSCSSSTVLRYSPSPFRPPHRHYPPRRRYFRSRRQPQNQLDRKMLGALPLGLCDRERWRTRGGCEHLRLREGSGGSTSHLAWPPARVRRLARARDACSRGNGDYLAKDCPSDSSSSPPVPASLRSYECLPRSRRIYVGPPHPLSTKTRRASIAPPLAF